MGKRQGHWQAKLNADDASQWEVLAGRRKPGKWGSGSVNTTCANGLMAIAAARHVGVLPVMPPMRWSGFINAASPPPELRGETNSVTVYDDFAHHQTAIPVATLPGACASKVSGTARILAVLEPPLQPP